MVSALPMLGAMIAYAWYANAKTRRRAITWYLIALLLFVVSLLGKATAVMLPVLLLLMDLWPLGRMNRFCDRRLLLEKVPFAVISVGVSWLAVRAQHAVGAAASLAAQPMQARLTNAIVCYVLYVGKFFLPMRLAVFYPLQGWPLSQVVACVAVLLAITAFVVWSRRLYLIAGWFWFLIMLLPVCGLFQSGQQAMADRYMYLPMIGLIFAVVWGLAEILPARTFVCTGLLGVVLLSADARKQVGYWRDSRALFERAIAMLNEGADLHIQLARLDLQDADRAGAQREYEVAARLAPADYVPQYDLGNLMLDQPTQAIPHYELAPEAAAA